VRPEDIRRYGTGKVASKLFFVRTVSDSVIISFRQDSVPLIQNVDHPLRISISEVTLMRRTEVYLLLIQRIFHFVREDACRQARDHFGGFIVVRGSQYIIVDQCVIS